jgi:hypothetical protein
MTKSSIPISLALLAFVSLAGCQKKDEPQTEQKTTGSTAPAASAATAKAGTVSAEKNSFQEVTSQLDPGGNVYLYLGTEQWLENLSGKVSNFRELLGAIPDVKDEERGNIEKAFNVLTNVIHSSGVEDVSGVGLSSIATEKGFYRTKALLHHYKGKGDGFLWKMFGEKPHELAELNLLSTNTALAIFSDLQIPLLWETIRKQAAQSGFPQAEETINKMPEAFEKATGLKWDQVLASLGNEYGFVVTLDEAKKVSLPIPGAGQPMEIPAPGLMLVAKVKDDTIFNRIDTALKATGMPVTSADQGNVKMRTVAIPLPLPIQLAPTVAAADGYLFIGTSDSVIKDALAVKAGQAPGLKTTDEFQRVAKNMPSQGNSFTFLSSRFGKAFMQVQSQAMASAPGSSKLPKQWLQSFANPERAGFGYSVAANTDEGWLTVVNGNQHAGTIIVASTVVPVAVGAALVLPALAKAKQNAQKVACINNLRMIDSAKQQWALENKKKDSDTPTQQDLLQFLPKHKFPVCPGNGDYTINEVSSKPQCSVAGHAMPE